MGLIVAYKRLKAVEDYKPSAQTVAPVMFAKWLITSGSIVEL